MSSRYVITITHECGSHGKAIAKIMASSLGINLYTSDILKEASQNYDISSIVSSGEEKKEIKRRNNNLFRRIFLPGYDGNATVKNMIFTEREKVMRLVAENESCIFLGNYADFTFHDYADAVHLYIYSSFERRAANYMEDFGVDEEEASNMIKTADEALAYGYEYYTGYAPDNRFNRHMMIDSSLLGVEGTAGLLAEMIRLKFGGSEQPKI